MIKLSNKVDLCSINVYEYLIEDVNLLNSFIEYAKNTNPLVAISNLLPFFMAFHIPSGMQTI